MGRALGLLTLGVPLRRGRSRGDFTYLFRDQFGSGSAATGRIADPGPGTWTFSDPTGQLSISSSRLQIAAGANTPLGYSNEQFARQAGRALLASVTGDNLRVGWGHLTTSDTAKTGAFLFSGTSLSVYDGADFISGVATLVPGTTYEVAVVLRSAGCLFLIRGGAFVDWTLVWVSNTTNNTGLRVSLASHVAASGSGSMDDIRAVDLTGSWASDWGIATGRVAAPASGTDLAGSADGFTEVTWTPDSTGSNPFCQLWFRRTDANNGWYVLADVTNNLVELYEVTGGAAQLRASTTQTWTLGTAYRIVVRHHGTSLQVRVNNLSKLSWTATQHQTAAGVHVVHAVTQAIANLAAWPSLPASMGGA